MSHTISIALFTIVCTPCQQFDALAHISCFLCRCSVNTFIVIEESCLLPRYQPSVSGELLPFVAPLHLQVFCFDQEQLW